jgi:exopolysaccharide biosynthesis polyprenyl glycosylphosphotransferase
MNSQATARATDIAQHEQFADFFEMLESGGAAARQSRKRRHLPSGRWIQLLYIAADIAIVLGNGFLAFAIREWIGPQDFAAFLHPHLWITYQPAKLYSATFVLYAALIVLCSQTGQLYRTVRSRTNFTESLAVLKAVSIATILLTAFVFLAGLSQISRLVVILSGVLNLISMVSWRILRREIVKRRVADGVGARNVLIVGAGQIGKTLASYLERNQHLGYIVKGFLDENANGGRGHLGGMADLACVAQKQFVDEIFVTVPEQRSLVKQIVLEGRRLKLNVSVVPELFDGLGWRAPIHHIGEIPLMELHRESIPEIGLIAKRFFDIIVSTTSLILVAPAIFVCGIIVKLDSSGPALYQSPRVGKKGRVFTCYKLRTMVADADAKKELLRSMNERSGPFFKINNDPRVTQVGRFLRQYSIDELPQLWNVLKGDMSLVGPRPHPLDDYSQYDVEHLDRLDVRPGMTGLWQVKARRDPSFEKGMALDLQYIADWSLWLDFKILLQTIPEIVRASGN